MLDLQKAMETSKKSLLYSAYWFSVAQDFVETFQCKDAKGAAKLEEHLKNKTEEYILQVQLYQAKVQSAIVSHECNLIRKALDDLAHKN